MACAARTSLWTSMTVVVTRNAATEEGGRTNEFIPLSFYERAMPESPTPPRPTHYVSRTRDGVGSWYKIFKKKNRVQRYLRT